MTDWIDIEKRKTVFIPIESRKETFFQYREKAISSNAFELNFVTIFQKFNDNSKTNLSKMYMISTTVFD